MDSSSWSAPTKITVDRISNVGFPHIFASHDSAWVLYNMKDDENRDQVFGQMGHALPDSVPTGGTMTWNGFVYLDHDFTIPATSKLIIMPGTKVFAKAGAGVDILCRGQIEAIGTEEDPIAFPHSWAMGKRESGTGLRLTLQAVHARERDTLPALGH